MTEPNLTSNCYYILDELGAIAIHGEGAEKFLQGQLTCDVTQLTHTNYTYGAHCDPKGRIQFNFQLLKTNEGYLLILPSKQTSQAITVLKKYAVFYRTEMLDIRANQQIYGISGIEAAEVLSILFPTKFQMSKQVNIVNQTLIIHMPGTTPRFLIIDIPESYEKYRDQLTKLEIKTYQDWELQNIFAGIAIIYPETSGLFTPHEINLHLIGGVSFTKGCYTGQEIIARMQYLGKLKNQLFRIRFTAETLTSPGTTLFDDQQKQIGHIVTSAPYNSQHFEALAVLPIQILASNIRIANSPHSISNKDALTY